MMLQAGSCTGDEMDKLDLPDDLLSGRILSATHIKVYKWAIDRGFVSANETADVLAPLTPAEAAEAMEDLVSVRLMEHELFTGSAGHEQAEKRWRVLNPQIAAARLSAAESRLRQLMVDLNASRQSLDDLYDMYSVHHERNADADPLEVVGSLTDVNSLIDKASADCRVEMISCQPGGGRPPEQLERAVTRDIELLERGMRIRTLYQHSARHHPPTRAYVERVTAAGAEIRTSAELNGRLLGFDGNVVFIPHHAIPGGATVIRDPSMVSYLYNTFERAWDLATPFQDSPLNTAELSDVHRCVLRLLSEGVRDETMARRLGVSLRTCRKYVAEIFDRLGAESRFQAGYLTGERGLLK
jgi:DNA-binding CsgD family transcriptional regulator